MVNWSNDVFIECYNSIKYQDQEPLDESLIINLKDDLINLLSIPPKNESSKQKLIDNKSPIEFSNGDKFKLNDMFVENSILLSTELGLNELVSAEILFYANNSVNNGIAFIDHGRLAFYKRYNYILNIVGYLITSNKLNLITSDVKILGDNLINSFNKIYEIISNLNDLINKQVMTNTVNDGFVDTMNYSKTELFDLHELLGQLYFNLVETNGEVFGQLPFFEKISNHLTTNIDDNDCLILHFLPGIFSTLTNLDKLDSKMVVDIHKHVTQRLSTDYKLVNQNDLIDLSNSKLKSYEILIDLIFLTNLIPWCKLGSNYEHFHFNDDVLNYIQICLNYGVLENLLRLTSSTTNNKTIKYFELENLCDFRSALQSNLVDLSPIKFSYNDTNIQKRFNLDLTVSDIFKEELIPFYWHNFFINFISHVAIVLTQLRDSEEDYLLSSINRRQRIRDKSDKDPQSTTGLITSDDTSNSTTITNVNDLNMEEIYSRAELERFYLSFVYTYKNRSQLCSAIWENNDSNGDLIGFITWGINNNSSPLITATFCLLLSSLACKADEMSTIKIWESLINNNSNLKKSDYSKISMDSIIESLNYYLNSLKDNFENDLNNQVKNKQKRQEFLFSTSTTDSSNNNTILIELSEDSVIFISGFTLLISSIVENLSYTYERSTDIRQNLFNRFKPIIIGFLKFDNLIVNSRISIKSNEFPIILIDDSNRSTLINLMLNFLNSFIDPTDSDYSLRHEIWDILDKWMFHQLVDDDSLPTSSNTMDYLHPNNANEKVRYQKNNVNIKNAFKLNLINLPNVFNFVELVKNLLSCPESEYDKKSNLQLPFPDSLGVNYRLNNQIGIWPYIEYLTQEILGKSGSIKEKSTRVGLQLDLINLIHNAVKSLDWKFLITIFPNLSEGIDYGKLFAGGLGFDSFVKLHHSVSIINFMLEEKVYNAVFDIIMKQEDESLVLASLEIVKKLTDAQNIFPILVHQLKEQKKPIRRPTSSSLISITPDYSIYYPSNFNVVDFLQVLSDNIPIVEKFGLLVNSGNEHIVNLSVDILTKINERYHQNNQDSNLLIKNKLLTIYFDSSKSNDLKFSVIDQFENGTVDIKCRILEFLIDDLGKSNGLQCLSHHLLGYEIKGNHLLLNLTDDLFITRLLQLLVLSLTSISSIDYNDGINIIDHDSTKMTSSILQLFNKLCFFSISSQITLKLLREFEIEESNLFEILIKYQGKIDQTTVWGNEKFNDDLLKDNRFIFDKYSLLTFFEFFKMRSLMIQYLTMEFHNLSQMGSIYKKTQYLDRLINGDKFLNESHQVLKFLDGFDFKFKDFEQFNYQKFPTLNLDLLVKEIRDPKELYDLDIVKKIGKIQTFNNYEIQQAEEYLVKFIIIEDLKHLQLKYLHNWVQLIEVIINDGNLSKEQNQNFILEVLTSILPKINEFFDKDINFSEELISLCVILFNYYDEEALFIERLVLLFSTCIKGVISSNSTIELRNDLYIIMNNFLHKSFGNNKNEVILAKMVDILEKTDIKFLEIICNDSIVNEGSIRITSVMLLETVIHLFNHFQNNYIIDKLIKNNSLLLIIRSVKRIDELLDNDIKDVSVILYELINFKSVINLLIRIGQIRVGSSYLIQSELFSIIKNLNFLKIDPDIGMSIKINHINEVNLNLDSKYDFLNYFEFLLPVFKLISILLIAMGPNYKPAKVQGKDLLLHFSKLKSIIIKKDILITENKTKYQYEKELNEIIKQFILIEALVEDKSDKR